MALKTEPMAEQLELFGCIQCGKCTGGCPVARKTVLNIRDLIYQMLVEPEVEVKTHQELWDCTCCFTCVERCPKDVRPAELIIGLRAQLVESGRIPETIGTALMGIFRQGNPTGTTREDRADWQIGSISQIEPISRGEGCQTLYFVGCIPSYDPRVQVVPRALVRAFVAAGLDFGTLGTEESCCGNEVRRMGEMGLFEMLVEENGELIRGVGASQLVTTSPHCFNTFKNEYGLDGIEVLHYTQLIATLIEQGRLKFGGEVKKTVTYHDPCFLGKQNHIFDEPRAILQAIPGVKLVEMDRNRERSLCCEGGGGRMWSEGTNLEERLAFQRVHEAADTGAEILAVACPFCLLTLEDAVKVQGLDEKLQVMDIMELVDLAL
ncbi:MAG: (Fe-S)-binding protein [Chloroflexota bacterium]|nr:(Fe-S)-binding protein [Chloroflexota bacterium]